MSRFKTNVIPPQAAEVDAIADIVVIGEIVAPERDFPGTGTEWHFRQREPGAQVFRARVLHLFVEDVDGIERVEVTLSLLGPVEARGELSGRKWRECVLGTHVPVVLGKSREARDIGDVADDIRHRVAKKIAIILRWLFFTINWNLLQEVTITYPA
mgnify:CR=1 FL=1